MNEQFEKATPRPWHIDKDAPIHIQGVEDGNRTPLICCMFSDSQFISPDEQKINAALIVTAANQFDALNAVAEEAKDLLKYLSMSDDHYNAIQDLKAALAKLDILRKKHA